jgi:alkanesulfonate monooxygenase SsuD/methylene tetrahydromethanopterin reductase-like flavin-dependent oxidoreductase (luciferase family)
MAAEDNRSAGVVTRTTHPWVISRQGAPRFGILEVDVALGTEWPAYLETAQMAEELGFDSYWTSDHPLMLADCWTALTALATATKRLWLGSLTSCIYYRSPALLARMAADVDGVSNGRLILGLGIGDAPDEFAQLGIPCPSVRERQQALEETIQIVEGLWGAGQVTHQGTHFRLNKAQLIQATGSAVPVQQPRVPLLIAGGGERVTLRQVAQYADVANFGAHNWAGSAFTLADVTRKYDALRRHCEALGRPYESILRTYVDLPLILAATHTAVQAKVARIPEADQEFYRTSMVATTPREAVAHYRALAAAGVQYFIPAIVGNDVETIRLLARQVIPEVVAA